MRRADSATRLLAVSRPGGKRWGSGDHVTANARTYASVIAEAKGVPCDGAFVRKVQRLAKQYPPNFAVVGSHGWRGFAPIERDDGNLGTDAHVFGTTSITAWFDQAVEQQAQAASAGRSEGQRRRHAVTIDVTASSPLPPGTPTAK
jgi:hypothetical protein